MSSFNQNQKRTRLSVIFVFIVMGMLAVSVIFGAGCSKDHSSVVDPYDYQNDDSDNYSDDYGNDPHENDVEELSFYEEQLVGLWSRYHSYDGSSMYLYFDGDRTACKWEEASGSDYRRSSSSYSNWYVDEANPIGEYKFRVVVEGAGISYTFDYLNDRIWPSSYSNLSYHSSSEGKSCDY